MFFHTYHAIFFPLELGVKESATDSTAVKG